MKNEIVILRGAERVRQRPAVIFGSDDADGAMSAVQMLVDLFAQEGVDGHCNQIAVTQYRDGSVAIADNGRGLFLGKPDRENDRVWKALFCELYAGSVYGSAPGSVFEETEEVKDSLELCAVQYASSYMDVCVVRDGFKQSLHFEKGENIGGLSRTPWEGSTGTYIRLQPDPEVFSDIRISPQQLAEKLQAIAIHIPGMKTVLRHELDAGFDENVFFYPEGIADYLQEHNKGRKTSPLYLAELTAEGRDRYNRPPYTANVRLGLCFAKNAGFLRCCHNLRELAYGGTHLDAAVERIGDYLGWMVTGEIGKEDILKHLQLVIVTNSGMTAWVNGTRTAIENILIRDLTQDAVGEDFRHFVKQNKDFLNDLLCK